MIKLKDLLKEDWNSNIWKSNIWKSHLWNSDLWKSHIWEDEKLNEVMDARNFWVLPNGEIEEVEDHIEWMINHDKDVSGSDWDWDTIYDIAFDKGYVRMVKEINRPLIVDYSLDRPPTNLQWRNIKDFAIENGWKLVDRNGRREIELLEE